MPGVLVWVFKKLLIYWDINVQPSLGFTEIWQKKRKYSVNGIWLKQHEIMDPSCLVSVAQADGGGGVMVWGIFSWHTLVPIEHRLNATAYLSIVADHVHPFMTTVYHLLMYFQQDNAPCHKAQIISDWFLEHDNEFTLLKWPPQSPDLNTIEHLWDVVEREILIMDVQTTNLQQLRNAIMSIWTKISKECFQQLIEYMPWRMKAVLEAKTPIYILNMTKTRWRMNDVSWKSTCNRSSECCF